MDPTLLQALISGGGAVLGGILGSLGGYLTYRQAKKKLRRDISIPLYQKQVEACSTILYRAQILVNELSSQGPLVAHYWEKNLNDFTGEMQRAQFLLPARIIKHIRLFVTTCKNAYAPHPRAEDALKKLIDEIRDYLDIDAFSEDMIPEEWKKSKEKETPPEAVLHQWE